MKHIGRKLAVPAIGIVLAGGSFAFLASNSVADSHAGEGTGNIAGYTVSNVSYTYYQQNQGTPNGGGYIQTVSFTLDNPATEVSADIHAGYDFVYGVCNPTNTNKNGTSNASLGSKGASTVQAENWTCSTAYDGTNPSTINAAPVSGSDTVTVTATD